MNINHILNPALVVAIIFLFIALMQHGCASTQYVVQKCDLPKHEKPEMRSMETYEDFISYLKLVLQEYDLLLQDYEACRE